MIEIMKTLKSISTLLLLFLAFTSCGKSKSTDIDQPQTDQEPTYKVVGYMFSSGNLDTESAKIDFTKITHLNIAFINPDITGAFTAPTGLNAAIKRAHDHQVKILFSLAGGSPPEHLKDLLKNENRAKLVKNIVDFTLINNFDGIDVDLEGDFINEYYEDFIIELASSLKPKKKLITSAVATWNGNTISNKALAIFDFINVMSYDQTGPWNLNNPGPHSTYEAAITDLEYWNKTRYVPAAKIILGLPFYGYGFGTGLQESYTFKDIVNLYPESANVDFVEVPEKGVIYYNGISTIKSKVELSVNKKIGGVMIWHLLGDASGDKSLLSIIHNNKK
jgi:chitinase